MSLSIHNDKEAPSPARRSETYQEFLIRARREADEDSDKQRPASLSSAASTRQNPASTDKNGTILDLLWYGALLSAQAAVGSTGAALVFLGRDARRYGPRAGHVVWLVLSLAAAGCLCGLAWALWGRRRERARRAQEAAALELQRVRRRAARDVREREIQRAALERATRRSLCSADEAERSVRVLARALSAHGVEDPLEANEEDVTEDKKGGGGGDNGKVVEGRKTPGETTGKAHDGLAVGDSCPMTEEEREDRREVREELREKRRWWAAAGEDDKEQGEQRRAEERASRSRASRSRDNVGSWIERQSQVDAQDDDAVSGAGDKRPAEGVEADTAGKRRDGRHGRTRSWPLRLLRPAPRKKAVSSPA